MCRQVCECVCVCVYGLQKLQSGRGELLSQLSAAKKQASEQEEPERSFMHWSRPSASCRSAFALIMLPMQLIARLSLETCRADCASLCIAFYVPYKLTCTSRVVTSSCQVDLICYRYHHCLAC